MATAIANHNDREIDRRDYMRDDLPLLSVNLGGTVYKTANWSMGGLLIDGYEGPLTAGALVTVGSIGTDELPVRKVNVRARVIRGDSQSGHLAVTFLGLDTPAYDLLKAITADRVNDFQPH